MTATWTDQEKLATQTSITYEQSGDTYDQANTQYNGKTRATWTDQTKQ